MGKEGEALIIALDERFAVVIDESGLFPHVYQQYQNMSVTHRFCLHLSSGNYRPKSLFLAAWYLDSNKTKGPKSNAKRYQPSPQ
jgi:hypothetical protein